MMKISACSLVSIVVKLRTGRPENRGWIPGRGSPSPPRFDQHWGSPLLTQTV